MSRLGQMALMAAIVATMLFLPAVVLLAAGLGLAGIPLIQVVTFGGALGASAGAIAWWLMFFAAALVYAGFAYPD